MVLVLLVNQLIVRLDEVRGKDFPFMILFLRLARLEGGVHVRFGSDGCASNVVSFSWGTTLCSTHASSFDSIAPGNCAQPLSTLNQHEGKTYEEAHCQLIFDHIV